MDFTFLQSATDYVLEFQWNYVNHCLKCGTNYPGMSLEETKEFKNAIFRENQVRWDNYQKQKFQKMLIETFGDNAITIS
jgi:hypothetical protein